MTEFLVRPETFGATVYDPQSLSYFFVDAGQFAVLRSFLSATRDKSALMAPIPRISTESDISGGKFAWLLTALTNGSTLRRRSSPAPLPADSLAAPIRRNYRHTNPACQCC